MIKYVWTCLQGPSMRDVYHDFLKKEMKVLKEKHPSWTGKEVLAEARKMSGSYRFYETVANHFLDSILVQQQSTLYFSTQPCQSRPASGGSPTRFASTASRTCRPRRGADDDCHQVPLLPSPRRRLKTRLKRKRIRASLLKKAQHMRRTKKFIVQYQVHRWKLWGPANATKIF